MQIRDLLITRITEGEWMPGSIIPSEIRLAKELNVSQGTARKAITELVETNVLVRRQGRGTFIATHDNDRALFHFFHIYNDSGSKLLPECQTLSSRRKRASRIESCSLAIPDGATVIRIERIRKLEETPVIVEIVTLPAEPFDELGGLPANNLPNTLYELYESKFNITIHHAKEELRAAVATKHEASLLGLAPGDPVLEIKRVAFTLDNTPVELRTSRCNTLRHHYQNMVV